VDPGLCPTLDGKPIGDVDWFVEDPSTRISFAIEVKTSSPDRPHAVEDRRQAAKAAAAVRQAEANSPVAISPIPVVVYLDKSWRERARREQDGAATWLAREAKEHPAESVYPDRTVWTVGGRHLGALLHRLFVEERASI